MSVKYISLMGNSVKKVVISGYYGFGNTGDEAILSAMIKALKTYIMNVEITVISKDSAKTSSLHNVKSVQRNKPFDIFRAILKCDLFISGGGGLIQDVTGVSTIQYYLGMVFLAKILGKKVMYYAQGIGPIMTDRGKSITRFITNMIDVATLRDDESRRCLVNIGVNSPPIVITADPVLALEPEKDDMIEMLLCKEGIKKSDFNVGISIRPWKTNCEYLKVISEVSDRLINEFNARIILIPFQKSQDLEICEKVRSMVKGNAIVVNGDYSPSELQGMIGKMDILIGMRLHSLIFGSTLGVPMIGIVYDPKVRNFSELFEIPCIDLKDIDNEKLYELIKDIHSKREMIKNTMKKKHNELKVKALMNAEIAKQVIEGIPVTA